MNQGSVPTPSDTAIPGPAPTPSRTKELLRQQTERAGEEAAPTASGEGASEAARQAENVELKYATDEIGNTKRSKEEKVREVTYKLARRRLDKKDCLAAVVKGASRCGLVDKIGLDAVRAIFEAAWSSGWKDDPLTEVIGEEDRKERIAIVRDATVRKVQTELAPDVNRLVSGGWAYYEGSIWHRCNKETITEMGLMLTKGLKDAHLLDAQASNGAVTRGITLGRMDEAEMVLDRTPHILGLPEGKVVDLRDMTIRECVREDFITQARVMEVAPDFTGPPKKYIAFLRGLLGSDNLVECFRLLAGMSMWAQQTPESVFVRLYGTRGLTGKSAAINLMMECMGDDMAVNDEHYQLFKEQGAGHQEGLVELSQATFINLPEWDGKDKESGRTVSAETVKSRCDGKEFKASRKGQGSEKVRPIWTIWGSSNHAIAFPGDGAVLRRLIEFKIRLDAPELTQEGYAEMEEELPLIAGWLIQAAVDSKGHLPVLATELLEHREVLRRDVDPLAEWIKDHLVATTAPGYPGFTSRRSLLEAAERYATFKQRGRDLYDRLREHGFQETKYAGELGFKLKITTGDKQMDANIDQCIDRMTKEGFSPDDMF